MKLTGKKLAAHAAADIFPLLDGVELQALADDIRVHGLLEPIMLYEGKILDGRNRHRACQTARVSPRFEQWRPKNGESAVDYVISLNLKRRHLSPSEQAMVGGAAVPLYVAEAKEREREGGRLKGSANLRDPGKSSEKAAAAVGVSSRSIEAARRIIETATPELVAACKTGKVPVDVGAKLAREAPAKQRRVVANVASGRAKNAREAVRSERLAERHKRNAEITKCNAAKLPKDRRYSVLYADPPWQYEHAISTSREIEEQYPTLDVDAIGKIEVDGLLVPQRAADDCVLFLWATSPKLSEALEVLVTWGFVYRTCAIWDKEKIGMGFYFRQQHELLLVATKGSPATPPPAARLPSVFRAPRGKHSEKPTLFYDVIEAMYPGAARLELFARGVRPGWDRWGNQAPGRVGATK